MKLLIIEDDTTIVDAIKCAFKLGWPGIEMVSVDWGQDGILMAETESPDAIILDLGLPDINGMDVIKGIRKFSKVPILVLTARTEETIVVQALEAGANDYVSKPLRQMELLARVKRLIQTQEEYDFTSPVILGPLLYDYEKREVVKNGKTTRLRSIENSILHELLSRSPNVISQASLIRSIWGEDYSDAGDTLKVHIRHLREKIEDNPSQPRMILTKSGYGYYFVKP
jgi:two-component system KDP operon response regulator KdpE